MFESLIQWVKVVYEDELRQQEIMQDVDDFKAVSSESSQDAAKYEESKNPVNEPFDQNRVSKKKRATQMTNSQTNYTRS